jgi:DNA helicase II / ATP-dependent DNA helicase PcrA
MTEKTTRYKKNLNPSQLEAVQAPDGATLIIAGAGSGKTRTLVYRVAWLVEQGVDPDRILLLTFTRKAAQEMLSRVEAMMGISCREISGGTFHSLGYRILRRQGGLVGLAGHLTVMDRPDAVEIMGRLIKADGLDLLSGAPGRKDLMELISRINNRALDFDPGVRAFAPHWENLIPRLNTLRQAFEEYKRRHALLDYDDLLLYSLKLFAEHPAVALRLSEQYRYVMVDEYQDTNLLQAQMVRALIQTHGNLMVVGDDSQSIYGFRGAQVKNILEVPRDFPRARIVKLEENYRSSQAILTLANTLISFAVQRHSKCLRAHNPAGEIPRCVELAHEEAQSQFIVKELKTLQKQGISWAETAVLFRAGHHSFNLEIHLQKSGIPFVKYGGRKLTEGAHIKDLLAYLKVARNPQEALSWERILRHLEGLGPKRAGQIVGGLLSLPEGEDRIRFLREYPRPQPQLGRLGEMLSLLGDEALSPSAALEIIWEYYRPLLPRLFEDPEYRQKDIEELLRVSNVYTDVDEFLGDLLLETPDREGDSGKERLVLSTVHSAKGLEWRAVFIIWVTEGRFPSTHARESLEELEEERRLLYVAITRAKEKLFLTYPLQGSERGGGWQHNEASRFIAQLPEEVLRRQTPVRENASRIFQAETPRRPVKEDGGYPAGLKVYHPIFGSGIVEEPPQDRKVRVKFRSYGSKVLHLDFARLEKA